jgi:hypothetical protein
VTQPVPSISRSHAARADPPVFGKWSNITRPEKTLLRIFAISLEGYPNGVQSLFAERVRSILSIVPHYALKRKQF